MVSSKRYCVQYRDGTTECFREGFWDSDKGVIIKWSILISIFLFFTLWFVGGYIHAKSRLRKGLPLLAYHRWLVPYNVRRKYGQTPQNHFTFYATQPGYGPGQQQYYGQRPDGTYPDAPPLYNGNDAPPVYSIPPGATKTNPNQNGGVEMPQYGVPPPPPTHPTGAQQIGVVGGGYRQDVEQGQSQNQQQQELPPRPQQAKLAITNFISRFKR